MQVKSSNKALQKHIDHYWIVEDCKDLLGDKNEIFDYPGVTPEIIIVLEGYYTISYLGKTYKISSSQVYSFIYDQVVIDLSTLNSFIVITFKPNALASFLPFSNASSPELMHAPISKICDSLDPRFSIIEEKLKNSNLKLKSNILDEWLSGLLDKTKEGFISDIISDLGTECSPQKIMAFTKYSYSTLERLFKRETGLTPKKYQSLLRYKCAVKEICLSEKKEWGHYINKYNYFDQSHFVKEIKKYTSFTPSQLMYVKSLPKVKALWNQ